MTEKLRIEIPLVLPDVTDEADRCISRLQDVLHTLRADPAHKGLIRWLVDVDPQAI